MRSSNYSKYLKKKADICFILAAVFFVLFVIINIAVLVYDVQPIGPEGSKVGFATINEKFAHKFPFDEMIYNMTEKVGKLLFIVVAVFGAIGAYQLVVSKSFARVDANLYALFALYIIMAVIYFIYDKIIIINYRPVLMNGVLEVSFPSTHTLMSVVILGSMVFQCAERIGSNLIVFYSQIISVVFMGVIIGGRMASGVHWFTDIVAGGLIGLSLVFLYGGVVARLDLSKERLRRHSLHKSGHSHSSSHGQSADSADNDGNKEHHQSSSSEEHHHHHSSQQVALSEPMDVAGIALKTEQPVPENNTDKKSE